MKFTGLYLLSAILLLIPMTIQGQEYSLDYGVISEAEWALKNYEKDPEAGAVVLYDIGISSFEERGKYSLKLSFKRRRRIKILAKSGYGEAEVLIPYYLRSEKILKISATTYNLVDGQVVKKVVEPATIFEEQFNEYVSLKKFAFPDIQVGTIIEYSYEMEQPFDGTIDEWKFQNDIPTIYSEFSVVSLPATESYLITQSIGKFDVQKEEVFDAWKGYENGGISQRYKGVLFNKDLIKRTYGLKHIPAFGDESYMTSKNDFIVKMEFKISTPREIEAKKFDNYANIWPALSKKMAMSQRIGGYIYSARESATSLIDNEFGFEDQPDDQKARKIINYVKNTYKWNGLNGKASSQPFSSFLESKEGTAADINLWLITLLRMAGIEANPIALSTRNHGKINMKYPYHRDFNYLVVLVTYDGSQYLTDGTQKYLPYNKIPPHCINEKGLVISQSKGGWVRLENNTVSKNNTLINIEPDPDQESARVGLTLQSSVYNSYLRKAEWEDDQEKIEAEMLDNGFTEIDKVRTFNFARNSKPYIVALEGDFEIESIRDKLIIEPFIGLVIKKNKLRQKERLYPIDFIYITQKTLKSQIKIPEGYSIGELPENVSVEDELAKIQLTYQKSGNQVIVNGFYTFKKIIYQPENYLKLKQYFDIIINSFNQELVLEKN